MKWLALPLVLGCFIVLSRDPFQPKDLYHTIPRGSESIHDLATYLDQPFSYLGEGAQVIAFVSEDQQVVLKLFKNRHKKRWKLSRLAKLLKKDWEQSHRKWTHKFQDTCRRYRLAMASLQEETGLLGIHFYKTKDPLFVTIRGRHSYQLNLADLPFILQKRARLATEVAKAEPEKARQALIDLFTKRINKGFSDPRQSLSVNYGFIGDQAIQLDVGKIEPFSGDREEELNRIITKVNDWIEAQKRPR